MEGQRTARRYRAESCAKRRASVLDCASPLALCSRPPIRVQFKFIWHRYLIRLEAVNGLHHWRGGAALEPRRRAERILVCHENQPVFHRVLMNVIQPRQIRALMREPGFPKIIPNPASGCLIQIVKPFSGFHMQHTQHIAQVGGIILGCWGMGDEVIMIGENRPRFQSPAKIPRHRQQTTMQNFQTLPATEMRDALIG
jgi:hypothetical protein